MDRDTEEHNSCLFEWDCEKCDRSLCLQIVAIADFPSTHGHFKILAFTNNKDGKDHTVVVKGDVSNKESVLTRLHSSCLTGDVFGSLRCDCGNQLCNALSMIEQEGLGVVLYMQQEGRGIGLTNKIRAYMLQDSGVDTYNANVLLGFQPDERQYEIAAAMLTKLAVKSVRLLTNNPMKIRGLEKYGIQVMERVGLEVPPNEHNRAYLTAKKRFGHFLSLDSHA
jgi:3,4-dihydroxy 2-butanone 4-phosphate synthase/GTP cyclohydrolase II